MTGFVKNASEGVIVEVQGANINGFLEYITAHVPPLSLINECEIERIPEDVSDSFNILASEKSAIQDLMISPDIALCDNCRKEFERNSDRRHDYPFINCTDCGPRFTIIESLPYDRPNTTMKPFVMCRSCKEEYSNPLDRRYHAQPISCYDCGPRLIWNGSEIKDFSHGIFLAAGSIKKGNVVAVKGLGGFHLACLASSDGAVHRMRKLKMRERKPFALMGTMDMIERNCQVSDAEKNILGLPAAPIVLLKRKTDHKLSEHVSPGKSDVGFMLPYTPLHLMMMDMVGEPMVMTSANISDEPIIYRDDSEKLSELCDDVLSHNRHIHVFADDSVTQVFNKKIYMIRRSRGFVPFPVLLSFSSPRVVLGLGALLKTNFTFLKGNGAMISQYIGDTDSPISVESETFLVNHFMKIFSLTPELIAIDKHPDYPHRAIAENLGDIPIVEIQHHKAHVGSLLAEHQEEGPIIGVSMDGTGYGDDGHVWGGEFFTGNHRGMERAGHLKNLFLPGGDQSIREPWRFAVSVLKSAGVSTGIIQSFLKPFELRGQRVLELVEKEIGGVWTSSCGRLFDAVASILGIGHVNTYEGELPMGLQDLAETRHDDTGHYTFEVTEENGMYQINFLSLISEMISDNADNPTRAIRFHRTLARSIVHVADLIRSDTGINLVGLTGGVFQNLLLLRLTKVLLEQKKFRVLIHSAVPPNDGGVSLGQVFLAAPKG